MNQKDFNILINIVSDTIKPINQLLYQCLILIVFYYFFTAINFTNISLHKSFTWLFIIICIIIDWFIWNNIIQTLLFASILIIYITYNINIARTVSTFIDTMNKTKDITDINKMNEIYNNIYTDLQRQTLDDSIQENDNAIKEITYIPKYIDLKNNITPSAFDKKLDGINELKSAYTSSIPNLHITDSQYAEIMLKDLYDTPQYKNIHL